MPNSEKALLFDIDGTLMNTDALHLEAFNKVFGLRGHLFDHGRSPTSCRASRWRRSARGFSAMSRRSACSPSWRRRRHLSQARQSGLPLPGLMALLDLGDRANVPMAAVTNAPRLNAE